MRCPQVEMKTVAAEYKNDRYRYFHSNTSCQQPFPASNGSFHAMCCEHLERRPAEVVQELRIAFWDEKRNSSPINLTPQNMSVLKTFTGTEEDETFAADEQRGQFEHGLGESLRLARV